MKLLIFVMFLLPAMAQTGEESRDRSAIAPKTGPEILKPKDYHDATGYWHPFTRMPRFVAEDQKAVWTSPFHTSRRQLKLWLILGGATGALIGTDKYISKNAPTTPGLRTLGSDVSYLGDPYTLLPLTAGFYFGGTAFHDDHFREAGLLSFESLANVTIVQLALKSIFDRQRPTQGHGNGEFEASSSPRYNSSFPSGHAIETFAMASVFAHEYPHTLWVKILAYAYAGGVVGARLAANQHFPGDVMAGGAIGWFIGDYVCARRHNPELEKKPTLAQRVLNHISIGGPPPAVPGQ
ncbi:MAG TPA: phosphatase PAP2 family protein [Bryobacteraceae bacterium]|nr:phosphatase PAP2 family protein [Bryobacteraceae bacterium]